MTEKNTDIMDPKIETKKDYFAALDQRSHKFTDVLPPNVNTEDFIAVCKQAVTKDPKLLDAMKVNPASVFQAFLNCARDGLIPDGREAHIDARNDKRLGMTAAYMPMKLGILKRMHRSAQIREIGMSAVYEGDEFDPDLSEGGKITHKPTGQSKKIIAAYAYVITVEGGSYRKILWRDDINKRKACASTKYVWNQWEAEMAAKSALRALSDELPLSSEERRIIHRMDDFADLNRELLPEPTLPKRLDISLEQDSQPMPHAGEGEEGSSGVPSSSLD